MSATQQRFYEGAYETAGDSIGIPDPKIAGEKIPSNQRILTLGGGIANDVWHLAQNNFVLNVDYAAPGLRLGNQRGVHGVAADLNFPPSLPLRNCSFDLVVCNDILEHLLDPLAIVKEISRVLRDEGTVIINVPNHFYWWMRLRLLFGKGIMWRTLTSDHSTYNHEWDYMHIRFFTYKGFRQFLSAAGLEPVRFYWDFGNLAHYDNPDRQIAPQLRKRAEGRPLSRRAQVGLYVVRPLWRVFNLIFPPRLRSAIVALSPGLLSGSFYVRCRRKVIDQVPGP
jgi:SAM-dependent methyltransferase